MNPRSMYLKFDRYDAYFNLISSSDGTRYISVLKNDIIFSGDIVILAKELYLFLCLENDNAPKTIWFNEHNTYEPYHMDNFRIEKINNKFVFSGKILNKRNLELFSDYFNKYTKLDLFLA